MSPKDVIEVVLSRFFYFQAPKFTDVPRYCGLHYLALVEISQLPYNNLKVRSFYIEAASFLPFLPLPPLLLVDI